MAYRGDLSGIMTSTIILYQTEITPERNAKVDSIESYLNTCHTEVISNFQYVKIDLDITIKVNMPQSNTPAFNYNYLSIKREDDAKKYYYFILKSRWLSANTIELQLSLDTINTFSSDLVWTKRTNITRQHKDRFNSANKFVDGNDIYLHRIVDRFEEGITPVKTLESSEKIEAGLECDHYLIYRSKGTTDTNPIDCFYCTNINLYVQGDIQNGIISSEFDRAVNIIFYSRDNEDFQYIGVNGNTITIGKNQKYKALILAKGQASTTAGFDVIAVTENGGFSAGNGNVYCDSNVKTRVLENLNIAGYIFNYENLAADTYGQLLTYYNDKPSYRVSLGTAATEPLKSIYDIDRTDSRLVKIIKLPYAPFGTSYSFINGRTYIKIPKGWSLYENYIRLDDLNEEFLYTVAVQPIDELTFELQKTDVGVVDNNLSYESKLYNSNYYTLKYVYDNFEKEILLERTTPLQTGSAQESNPYVTIKFKQSNNISSNSLFDFQVNGVEKYEELSVYSKYLNVNRSQEVAIYTSPYLDYIRNGYNYDKKAQALQTQQNVISAGASLFTSLVSQARGGQLGQALSISMAGNLINSLSSIATNAASSELAIQQKLNNASRSPASVSSTVDLNLLSYYNGNRLIRVTESCSPAVKQAIYNLFRLTGYACNDYGIPDFNSRIYYNFVQCKADFDGARWFYGQNILDDIKAKYEIGVTVFHKYNDSYDWLQEKENFESWLATTT